MRLLCSLKGRQSWLKGRRREPHDFHFPFMLNVYEEIAGLVKVRKDYHTSISHCDIGTVYIKTTHESFGVLLG